MLPGFQLPYLMAVANSGIQILKAGIVAGSVCALIDDHCKLLNHFCLFYCLCRLQARPGNPPDVWKQLQQHLMCDAACREALLKSSSRAAAAPAEPMPAQPAAALADEAAN